MACCPMRIDHGLSLPSVPPETGADARQIARVFLTFLRDLEGADWGWRAERFRAWGLALEARGIVEPGRTRAGLEWAARGRFEMLLVVRDMFGSHWG